MQHCNCYHVWNIMFIILGVLLFTGCLSTTQQYGHPTGQEEATKPSHITYMFDASMLLSDSNAFVIWHIYASYIADDMEKFYEQYGMEFEYALSFETELAAREEMVMLSRDLNTQGMKSQDKYLAELDQIYESGYFREYVFEYYKQDTWEMPEGLKLEEFKIWMTNTFPEHTTQTKVKIIYNPDRPGETIFIEYSLHFRNRPV